MGWLRYILFAAAAFFSIVASASDPALKEAFYQSRIDDKSLSAARRILYMDSLIALKPGDVEVRKLKSDLCFNSGDYAGAAKEYMTLAGRLKNRLVEHDRLRAMVMAARCLWLSNRPIEASNMALDVMRVPKSDSLTHYNLMARELAITTALEADDPRAARGLIHTQEKELERMLKQGIINKGKHADYESVLYSYKSELFKLERNYSAALNAANRSMAYTHNKADTAEVNIIMAGVYASMGEDKAAIDIYRRNIPLNKHPYNKRSDSNDFAELLLKNGYVDEALEVLAPFDEDNVGDVLEIRRLKIKGRSLREKGDVAGAYESLSRAMQLEDSISSNGEMLASALREFESGLAGDALKAEMHRADNWRTATLSVIGLAAAVIAVFGVAAFIKKRRRNSVINKNEATDTSESRQLVSAALQMSRMAEAVSSIGEIAAGGAPGALERITNEIKQLDYSVNTWEVFRSSFESMHPGFFEALAKDCPHLSIGEQRMAAYIILGLTNKEIASLINRQPRTVETIKYRLRKDMNIPSEIPTADYLRRYLPIRS